MESQMASVRNDWCFLYARSEICPIFFTEWQKICRQPVVIRLFKKFNTGSAVVNLKSFSDDEVCLLLVCCGSFDGRCGCCHLYLIAHVYFPDKKCLPMGHITCVRGAGSPVSVMI